MGSTDLRPEEIMLEVQNDDLTKVKVAITDIDGVLRGKYISKEKFLSAAEGGFGFCNVVFGWDCGDVCYDNSQYTGWHTGYPDARARLDLTTYRRVPWDGGVPFFLADFEDAKGRGLDICPRNLLRKIIRRAHGMGFEPRIGVEYEWFNFRETPASLEAKGYIRPQPLTPGMFGYSVLRSSYSRPYFEALMDETRAFGVPLEGLHTETGPGVFEAAIAVADALEAADRAVLFKTAVKEIAYRFDILPTFMAKWDANLPGCSGHLHQSLTRHAGGDSAFHDESHPLRMSSVFESYLAGQMSCLPEVLPFFAPNVNSFKRLVEGHWAPTRVTWGADNRTTAFRVIPGSPKSTRLETRVSGSDINPYLAIAAAVATGLHGIERDMTLDQQAVQGNAYAAEGASQLPGSLVEATQRLSQSPVANALFGEAFVDHFCKTRLWEWQQFQKSVTNWEMQRYFEII